MSLVALLATIGAGIGLSAGLAFNLRLAAVLGSPLIATFVTFWVGAALLISLWALGLDGARPDTWPALWTLVGGLLGVTYVTLSLITGARLGAGASTVAVTLGQVVGAAIITGLGWLGQTTQPPTLAGILSAALLLGAVGLLAADRGRKQE
ncbi:DMT family transporter [Deinococcus sp. AJ005]|uniref:DMT family transporter n=1 Tax=Deinococcus sp. AJ005 TaxID=2652443 RepID=UPI00125CA798|nr:DMT family transporter [Deinococcus sp. AJ005]QFP76863.1 EamA-like transporter family protein [Deinococcus sp. AJ005]